VLELTLLGLAVVLDTCCCCDARTQRGSFVQSWKYRYFVLDDETLTYYTRKGGARKGVFNITRATECTRQTCLGFRLDLLAYDRRLTCSLFAVLCLVLMCFLDVFLAHGDRRGRVPEAVLLLPAK
jgi:hypothetical protein